MPKIREKQVPSSSSKQHNLMQAVAHNPEFAKKTGIPQKVGRDFVEADKGRKFNRGGDMKESKAMMGKEVAFMKKKGAPKSMIKHEMAEMGMKKGGAAKKMMGGGKAYSAGGYTRAADGIAKKGKTKGTQVKMMGGGKC
jgi:hypothetical protein